MTNESRPSRTTRAVGSLLSTLQERAKGLSCLYAVEEILRDASSPLGVILARIIRAIPDGFHYADDCQARIDFEAEAYETPGYRRGAHALEADIVVHEAAVGRLEVSYREEHAQADQGPFLKEEVKLIETVAERIADYVLHQRLRRMFEDLVAERIGSGREAASEWRIALDLLRRTDPRLLGRVSRKMMNQLCWRGVAEAKSLLRRYGEDRRAGAMNGETNQPRRRTSPESLVVLSDETFRVASAHMTDLEILDAIQDWIHEDKASALVKPITDVYSPLNDVADAIRRFKHEAPEQQELSQSSDASVRVALISRFFSGELRLINVVKPYVRIEDFFELVDHIVAAPRSHGRLGGKSSGLFFAERILSREIRNTPGIGDVRTPKTWYLASDTLLDFQHYNNIDDVFEHKYKSIDEVRQEYPHIVQIFKNSHFSMEISKGLALALDDFGERPLIVRSSSLLEDRFDAAFSGKYKSLFLANQGTRKQRLDALKDAIAEVYASIFGPDPIEYRAERGLLDFNEEMGIMIQEVVGTRVGHYYFPAFAGVAFSANEFRWSPRIKREDGLIRLVPGLGTRAVDRITEDYPILIAPGQPKLRVNVSTEEIIRYAPKKIDVIDLESGRFETKDLAELLTECEGDYPALTKVISVLKNDRLSAPSALMSDFAKDDFVVTFDGLVNQSGFIKQIGVILNTLQRALGTPVDIEFASDGEHLYLLQCRPQSRSQNVEAAIIPDVPKENVVFSASRYVSNGRVPDITHVVYVDPEAYNALEEHEQLVAVGQAVGRLNKLLPKRQFILIGPGRWGSRGDIKLGVRATYSDINNTAVLVEVARKKGNYTPDLSFGTHFFQDLVEASIRYLPLYPDDEGVLFNEEFLSRSPNILANVLPEYAGLSHVVRVIDVPAATGGKVLRILMNAERDQALAFLGEPASAADYEPDVSSPVRDGGGDHWRWRLRMAERIGQALDAQRFGVSGLYVFGSTKNATAGPASDIDLLIHFDGDEGQRRELTTWLEGWSVCLAEANYLRTGQTSDGLLDVHIITDADIERRSSFAVKIGAITDAARAIKIGTK
ncbi:MAG: nucleotidyltransferase domain-containing protein [Proteobacteria bacterium]|jgi:predicted nucleotidyltransferase|nr:nucleotidyltransferase domain-containing protein [Pseudomonadota bacterium]